MYRLRDASPCCTSGRGAECRTTRRSATTGPANGRRCPGSSGPREVDGLLGARPDGFDFRRDVWPLVEKELGFAHYHRLFTATPSAPPWPGTDFEEKYAAVDDPAGRDPGPGRGRRARPRRPARPGRARPPAGRACGTRSHEELQDGLRGVHRGRPEPPSRLRRTAPTWPSSSDCSPSTASWSGSGHRALVARLLQLPGLRAARAPAAAAARPVPGGRGEVPRRRT